MDILSCTNFLMGLGGGKLSEMAGQKNQLKDGHNCGERRGRGQDGRFLNVFTMSMVCVLYVVPSPSKLF